jgi:hypothetical protein
MDITIYLARIIGISFIVLYGGFLLNNKYYLNHIGSLAKQPFMIMLSGLLSLVFGLIILQLYSDWTSDWRSLITAVAWLLVLSGVMRLLFPSILLKVFDSIHKHISFINSSTLIMFLIGVYLTFIGFASRGL